MMLIDTIPRKKIISESGFFAETLLILKMTALIIKLKNAHNTFMRGDESPLPGGLAKGVGNGLPEIPFTKWGTKFARIIPAKKAAM